MPTQSNNENSSSDRSTNRDRRGSLSLSDLLSSSRQPTSAYPGPITTAAAQANNQRRLSMSSASGSPPRMQSGFALRRDSVSSISDESAIDDTELASGSPTNPFVRRMSWGARALREVRLPTLSRAPTSPVASSPTVSRGFWLEGNKTSNAEAPSQERRSSLPAPPTNSISPKDKSYDPMQERMLRNDFYLD